MPSAINAPAFYQLWRHMTQLCVLDHSTAQSSSAFIKTPSTYMCCKEEREREIPKEKFIMV